MTITTEEAHKLWRALFDANWHKAAAALRSLAAERDALRTENEVMEAALRRINSSITPQKEIALQAENARLREALHKARAKYVELNDKGAAEAMAEIITEALGDDK
jgi:hypothetical protein